MTDSGNLVGGALEIRRHLLSTGGAINDGVCS